MCYNLFQSQLKIPTESGGGVLINNVNSTNSTEMITQSIRLRMFFSLTSDLCKRFL